uniref:Type I secretion outer membrane protein, TolC n=1 Tax=uncultured Thiotrichaceae bacterium TaxID=298394 RepID=A0A6S6UAQ6_9GAMM|nr:MAG: Type I secretion outer membrane protein, TolC precursor [uncultured Thiotrichaceae bacterium]
MKKTLSLTLLTALIISSTNLQAESLFQAYQDAKANDSQLKAQETGFLATLENKTQALSQKKPQVNLSGSTSLNRTIGIDDSSSSTSLNGSYTLNLSKSLYNKSIDAQIDQVDASILQAKLQLEEQRQNLILRVAQPYFNYLNAIETLRFATTEKKAVQRQLEQVKVFFDVGRSPITDLKEAESRYNLTVASEVAARQGIIDARENLRVLTRKGYQSLKGPAANLPLQIPAPGNINSWVALAKQNSKALQTAKQGIEVARQNIEVQRSSRNPVVNMYARHTGSLTETNSSTDPISTGASVGVEASMSLYQGGAHNSRIRQAQHQFRQSQQNYQYQERLIESQVRSAYLSIQSGISQIKAQQRALVSAQTAASATKTGFEVGTRTAVDVLTTLRDVFSARRNVASARNNYLLSTLSLRQAAGTLSEKDLQNLSNQMTQALGQNTAQAPKLTRQQQIQAQKSQQAQRQQAQLQAQRRLQAQRKAQAQQHQQAPKKQPDSDVFRVTNEDDIVFKAQ